MFYAKGKSIITNFFIPWGIWIVIIGSICFIDFQPYKFRVCVMIYNLVLTKFFTCVLRKPDHE